MRRAALCGPMKRATHSARVPLMHLHGSLDPQLKDNTMEAEKRYKKLGG